MNLETFVPDFKIDWTNGDVMVKRQNFISDSKLTYCDTLPQYLKNVTD